MAELLRKNHFENLQSRFSQFFGKGAETNWEYQKCSFFKGFHLVPFLLPYLENSGIFISELFLYTRVTCTLMHFSNKNSWVFNFQDMVTKVVPNESPWKMNTFSTLSLSQLLYQKTEKTQVIGFQNGFSSIIGTSYLTPPRSSSMFTRVHRDPQKAKGALCKVGGTPSFWQFLT